MGLEDIFPDDVEPGSSSSSSGSTKSLSPEEDDDYKVIGGGRWQKIFHKDKWDEVKRVLIDEFGKQPNVVLNSPAEERHDILHEAALYVEGEKSEDELENRSDERCEVCGKACTGSCTKVAGVTVHFHHTAGELAEYMKND